MSHFAAEAPEVVVTSKPGKMFNYWSTKMKVAALLLIFALYVYFLIFIKTIYLKSQKLDHIKAMAMETEKMMHNLHTIDRSLALRIHRVGAVYEDY